MFKKLCYASFVLMFFYMSFVTAYIEISNMPLILGSMMCIFFVATFVTKPVNLNEALSFEIIIWVLFTIVAFFSGLSMTQLLYLSTSNFTSTITTWIEYLITMIVVVFLCAYDHKVDNIVKVLLAYSTLAVITMLISGSDYQDTGRYSVSDILNPNTLGIALVFGIFAILYFWRRTKINKTILVILAGVFIYGIILTGSRKSLFGAALLIAVWFLLCFLPSVKKASAGIKVLSILSVLVLFMVGFIVILPSFQNTLMYSRIEELFDFGSPSRQTYYREAAQLFRENPVFGVGWQNFRFFSSLGGFSHSTYAEAIACLGTMGSFLYFVPYFFIIVKLIRIWKISRKTKNFEMQYDDSLMIGLMAVLLFLGIGVIHFYSFFSTICFGILISYVNITLKGNNNKKRAVLLGINR